jgi:hypothetical protein
LHSPLAAEGACTWAHGWIVMHFRFKTYP